MKILRALKSLWHLGRAFEVYRCLRMSKQPLTEFLAFLDLRRLNYPYMVSLHNGLRLKVLDWPDLTTAWVVFFGNEYRVKHDDKVIVDCGANIGAFSLFASQMAPHSRIFAIEPFPSTYRGLCEILESNRLNQRVTALNVAVVGVPRSVMMDDREGVASHSRRISEGVGVNVRGMSLEQIMEEQGLDEIDLLKVDIEGAEYELVRDTPISALRKMRRIGLEYHRNGNPGDIFEKLKSAGFRIGRYPKKELLEW